MLKKRPAGLPRRIPKTWWTWEKLPGRFPASKPAAFWRWRAWRLGRPTPKPTPAPTPAPTPPPPPKPKPKPKPRPTTMLMFDDVNVSLIPKNARAVAGYVDGHFATWVKVREGWPHAKKLMISVFAQDNGECLDVEPGDASIAEAAAWVKRQLAGWKKTKHDVSLPVVYTSASQGQKLVDTLTKAGLRYGKDYLWWSAHYDPSRGKHLCGPRCGFGIRVTAHATQFTDNALNRSLDESICAAGFFKR